MFPGVEWVEPRKGLVGFRVSTEVIPAPKNAAPPSASRPSRPEVRQKMRAHGVSQSLTHSGSHVVIESR